MSLAKSDPYLRRYSLGERLNHWLVAISFVLLVLSGLPFFHPFFWSLTGLFGGPTMTRILHPWIGLFMVLMFAIMAVRFFKESLIRRHDIQWLKQIDDVLANRDEKLPPVGKNNAGQKLVYWIMLGCIILLLITGVMIWQPLVGEAMPITLRRLASMGHAYLAFLAIITLIIHIYSGIWVKGSFQAMVRGRVSKAWARHHHDLWYEEEMEKERKHREISRRHDHSEQETP
ncbi:formate dehydrogenase subunit gamma [Halomonas sp. MCCC 1A11036]|uniref:Formate dehydrogenase subunit gamma n=1 Tax=Billgrantia zhangzhouensis TaxID=2733481 RepID=A0ABS9AA80_9GAMM|nr:formate dehydrogenase subunit gamma [Halomonas zhangzhouensis]MCE8018787.1 formate dehydrogenase subunit gamma [Halomonas zhangzhouensis]